MRFLFSALLLVLPATVKAITTGKLGNASVVTDNPTTTYVATLGNKTNGLTSGIVGAVIGSGAAGGTGVGFWIELDNFPDYATNGPFVYHIHEFALDASGNCSTAGAHLDPFERGETPACDASAPETCQVGDLSGKHGSINSSAIFITTYTDVYTSTNSDLGSFFGNRSLVIHAHNLTRLACANFTLATMPGGANGSASANGSYSAIVASASAGLKNASTATTSTGTETATSASTTGTGTGTGTGGSASQGSGTSTSSGKLASSTTSAAASSPSALNPVSMALTAIFVIAVTIFAGLGVNFRDLI